MKKALVIISTLIAINSFAQIKSYRLDSITNPEYHFKLLRFDLNLSQSNNGSSLNSTSTGSNLNGGFSSVYQTINNTARYQGTESVRANFEYNNYESNNSNPASTHSNLITNLNYNSSNRFYLFDNVKNHVVINPSASINYHKYQRTTLDNIANNNVDSENSDLKLNSDIGLGIGRLENVSDARIILFILEDLKANGLLQREPTHQEISELSDLAIFVKNKRIFDSRIKRIYELSAIDSLLSEKGLVKEADIGYHTILQDNWNFSVNPFRQRGYLFQYGVTPEFNFNWHNEQKLNDTINGGQYESLSDRNSEFYSASVFAKYEWYKPISQSLQNDIRLSINGGISQSYNRSVYQDPLALYPVSNSTTNNIAYQVFFEDEFGFYPTNRTYISFLAGVSLSGYHRMNENYSEQLSNNQNLYFRSGLNAYYYFSPQLRLSARYDANYTTQQNKNFSTDQTTYSNSWNTWGNLTLSYFLM